MTKFPLDNTNCPNCGRQLIKDGRKLHNFTYIVGTEPPGACVCFNECFAKATHKLITTGQLGPYRLPDWRRPD